jgi:hypothetical protein
VLLVDNVKPLKSTSVKEMIENVDIVIATPNVFRSQVYVQRVKELASEGYRLKHRKRKDRDELDWNDEEHKPYLGHYAREATRARIKKEGNKNCGDWAVLEQFYFRRVVLDEFDWPRSGH